jgi:hypothetical protein
LERLPLAGRSVSTASAEKNMFGFRARAFQRVSLASGRTVFSSCGADPSKAKKRLSAPTPGGLARTGGLTAPAASSIGLAHACQALRPVVGAGVSGLGRHGSACRRQRLSTPRRGHALSGRRCWATPPPVPCPSYPLVHSHLLPPFIRGGGWPPGRM